MHSLAFMYWPQEVVVALDFLASSNILRFNLGEHSGKVIRQDQRLLRLDCRGNRSTYLVVTPISRWR